LPLLHIGGYEWLDWDLHLDVVALCLLLEGSYLYAVTALRRRIWRLRLVVFLVRMWRL